MIKRIYLNQNLISQEINNKTHILINKQKDYIFWDKNFLGLSSYQNYFSLEIDENKNYAVYNNINNKNGNIVGKNLILSFEKLKQENKKQFTLQNKNDYNNDLLNEYNNHYENTKIQQRKLTAKDKNDRPIWNHTKSDETLKYNIFGYDVILCDEYSEYSETEKSTFITFGDLSQYKWNFQKQLKITKSTDFLFDQYLIAYKATFIADGNTVAKWAFVNVVRE